KHGEGGRTVGVNSEMDALPGIGHACGHNLIAIAGVAVACAMKTALEKFDVSGSIQLLGTPAEEAATGKVVLLEKGAYKDMDVCVMCHPAPGPKGSVALSSSLAVSAFEAEYFGHTAHAALSPWEGINALDAAVLAYNNVNALRQQLKPNVRVHGILKGKDWTINIIPDYAMYSIAVRAPTRAQQEAARARVLPCLEASAGATGCKSKISETIQMFDLRQNKALGDEVANIICSRYGTIDREYGIASASTDFGNVSYELPSLHPGFAIPTVPGGGNHTPEFAKAAATVEAHEACLDISKALAATGIRVFIDDEFFEEVKRTFEEDKALRETVL
ncbi:bacterial exopeptidase dimerization domain-containing protein, partial [Dendrothele bispora CBS 962.96]